MECLKNIFRKNLVIKPEPYENINDSEPICRFIFSDKYYSSKDKTVKAGAFSPSSRTGEASILRIANLTNEDIYQIDLEYISGRRTDNKKSKGRADLMVCDVKAINGGLFLSADIEGTHPRHANIKGYASEKSLLKQQITELANKSSLVLYKDFLN